MLHLVGWFLGISFQSLDYFQMGINLKCKLKCSQNVKQNVLIKCKFYKAVAALVSFKYYHMYGARFLVLFSHSRKCESVTSLCNYLLCRHVGWVRNLVCPKLYEEFRPEITKSTCMFNRFLLNSWWWLLLFLLRFVSVENLPLEHI